jgi:hypothetical protein
MSLRLVTAVFAFAASAAGVAQARSWDTGVLSVHNARGQAVALETPGRAELSFTLAPLSDLGMPNVILPVCGSTRDVRGRGVRVSAAGKHLATVCQGVGDGIVYVVNRREGWRGRETCADRAYAFVTLAVYEDRIACKGYDEKPMWQSSTTPPGPNAQPRLAQATTVAAAGDAPSGRPGSNFR